MLLASTNQCNFCSAPLPHQLNGRHCGIRVCEFCWSRYDWQHGVQPKLQCPSQSAVLHSRHGPQPILQCVTEAYCHCWPSPHSKHKHIWGTSVAHVSQYMNQNVISKGSLLHCELLSMLSMNFSVGNCFSLPNHVYPLACQHSLHERHLDYYFPCPAAVFFGWFTTDIHGDCFK